MSPKRISNEVNHFPFLQGLICNMQWLTVNILRNSVLGGRLSVAHEYYSKFLCVNWGGFLVLGELINPLAFKREYACFSSPFYLIIID